MGIFDLFRKKNSKDSGPEEDGKKLLWKDYIIIKDGKAYYQGDSHRNLGIILSDVWKKWFREEFDNYFKSIKRPIEEMFIPSSEFFKNSICPYCGFKLDKSPLKKTKCPNCHNYIYKRTNLITKEKMLFTEEQVNKLENERDEIGTKISAEGAILGGFDVVEGEFKKTKEELEKENKEMEDSVKEVILEFNGTKIKVDVVWLEFKKIKEELKKENKKIEDFDILRGILDRKQARYIKQNDWGFLRSTRYEMFTLLNAERRFQEAIRVILEVCYYDINGCITNLGTADYNPSSNENTQYSTEYIRKNWGLFRKPGELDKFLKEGRSLGFPLFDLRSGIVGTTFCDDIKKLKEKLNLQWKDVKNMFIERASQVRVNMMPVPPKEAWDILYNELNKEVDKL